MRFGDIFVELGQKRDQISAQIRDEYITLDKERRCAFRTWVDKLALAGDPPVYETGLNVAVQIHLQVHGLREMERVAVSPKTLAAGLVAWDEGKEYIHESIEF